MHAAQPMHSICRPSLAPAFQGQAFEALGAEDVGVVLLILVHDLQAVHVLDAAEFVLAVEHAVLADVEADQRAQDHRGDQGGDHQHQGDGVADQARPGQVGLLAVEVVLGGVADQPFRVVHLLHDAVAGVDARRAADALDLQAVADVDAGRADLHAHRAVDAVAQALGLVVEGLLARAALLATTRIVGDDQGVLVEHHALEARVGAHVDAHLLAQPAGVAVGGQGEEADPEVGPAVGLAGEQLGNQLADRREVADEGQAGDQADQQPQAVLGGLAQQLVAAHRSLVQLDALVAVAFGDLLAPHVDPGPHALRAGIATPDATGEHGDEEQAEGADDQQPGQQHEVLRPEGGAEDVELALG